MPDEILCHCRNVTRETIRQAIRNGAHDLDSVRQATAACTGNRCGELNPRGRCCAVDITALFEQEGAASEGRPCSCCQTEER